MLNGSSVSADNDCVTISGCIVTITCAGTYNISGTLTNGQIIVKKKDEGVVRLILNGVNIICSNNAPIFVKKSPKTVIILPDSTKNYLADGSSYNIYTGGTSTGTYTNGIYTGGNYSGGTLKKSFTVSSSVTSVSF